MVVELTIQFQPSTLQLDTSTIKTMDALQLSQSIFQGGGKLLPNFLIILTTLSVLE
jgi:hypothetical protein